MMQNNLKIAVTGGIGSGKSTVCKIIKENNLPVISCDEVYAQLLSDKVLVKELSEEFGNDILLVDGALNRKALSEIVFNDKTALEKLNSITHPAIMEEVIKRANNYNLCFCEVPLLFENGFEAFFDGVIVVLREENSRILSVMQRDGLDREAVGLRLNSQYNYDFGGFEKYYVIHNDGNLQELRQKTTKIIKKIQSKAL